MAASFDTALMTRVATAIGDEGRAKHHEFVRRGERGIYRGLTFWSPNINIFRDPRWGRGQETYGEDPFLTARMGVAFVKALQGDDPKLEDGGDGEALRRPQRTRGGSPHLRRQPERARPLRDLPARVPGAGAGREGRVGDGRLQPRQRRVGVGRPRFGQILRKDWGFDGYVVSDCGSIDDIFVGHKIVKTAEEAAALAVKEGCDLECGTIYDRSRPPSRRS